MVSGFRAGTYLVHDRLARSLKRGSRPERTSPSALHAKRLLSALLILETRYVLSYKFSAQIDAETNRDRVVIRDAEALP